MSIKLGDYSRYQRGILSLDDLKTIVTDTPTEKGMLKKQVQYMQERFLDLKNAIDIAIDKGRNYGDLDYATTLLSKIRLMEIEPNLTPEDKNTLLKIKNFIERKMNCIKALTEDIAEKTRIALEQREQMLAGDY